MKLTSKSRFAVSAMLDLAIHQTDGNGARKMVKLSEISERQDISLNYLEQLFNKLRKAGLVSSMRGPQGGYFIEKDLSEVTMADIILASEDTLDATSCGGKKNCKGGSTCIAHHLWMRLNATIYEYLDGISVQSVLDLNASEDDGPEAMDSAIEGAFKGNLGHKEPSIHSSACGKMDKAGRKCANAKECAKAAKPPRASAKVGAKGGD